jgi:hypothetical protein
MEEVLAWEVVDSLIPKSLLKREAMRAHLGEDWVEDNQVNEVTDIVANRDQPSGINQNSEVAV